ncbi:MAG TPA: class I fructose-bisphosphate aldolase [Sporichthyaceae bacterium]
MPDIVTTARRLVRPGRGILAADESIATMSARLDAVGVPASEATRRDYRALLLTTRQLSSWVSGMILCDETLRQTLPDGTPFVVAARDLDIQLGVKVDTGAVPLPFTAGGRITEGLDGLARRLAEYRELGATFAKWRAVLEATGSSTRTIRANAHALARYAALCQEHEIVPIVEPEILMDGRHEIEICQVLTHAVLGELFEQLDVMGVDPAGIVLKPNMVVPGTGCHQRSCGPEDVARRTLKVLEAQVPAGVPGVAFLSGGQSNARACANLAAINELAGPAVPWALTFSFGRALVGDALRTWRGDPAAVAAAQQRLAENCARAAAACVRSGLVEMAMAGNDHREERFGREESPLFNSRTLFRGR